MRNIFPFVGIIQIWFVFFKTISYNLNYKLKEGMDNMGGKNKENVNKGTIVNTPKPLGIAPGRNIRGGERPSYQAPPVPPKK